MLFPLLSLKMMRKNGAFYYRRNALGEDFVAFVFNVYVVEEEAYRYDERQGKLSMFFILGDLLRG